MFGLFRKKEAEKGSEQETARPVSDIEAQEAKITETAACGSGTSCADAQENKEEAPEEQRREEEKRSCHA